MSEHMSEVDELNTACSAYAEELTKKWIFTGWKPGQANMRLHAQWLRADEYEGERYWSEVQCFPLDSSSKPSLEEAKTRMRQALEGVTMLTKLAPEPLDWMSQRVRG